MTTIEEKLKIGFLISNKKNISLFYYKIIEKILLDDKYLVEFVFR